MEKVNLTKEKNIMRQKLKHKIYPLTFSAYSYIPLLSVYSFWWEKITANEVCIFVIIVIVWEEMLFYKY